MKYLISGFAFLTLFQPTSVWAQEGGDGGGLSMLFGIALIFAIFYFLIIRPQSKRAKQHAELVAGLEKGDQVVTQSGIYGKVHGLADRVITLEIAPNVRIRVDRNAIASKQDGNLSDSSQSAA